MNFAGYSYPVLTHEQISGQIEKAIAQTLWLRVLSLELKNDMSKV
jgi:hypothetical protein